MLLTQGNKSQFTVTTTYLEMPDFLGQWNNTNLLFINQMVLYETLQTFPVAQQAFWIQKYVLEMNLILWIMRALFSGCPPACLSL